MKPYIKHALFVFPVALFHATADAFSRIMDGEEPKTATGIVISASLGLLSASIFYFLYLKA